MRYGKKERAEDVAWLNRFGMTKMDPRIKKLAVSFVPLNAEIPLPDALTLEGETLRDEIVQEVVRALVGFSKGNRWPE